MRLIKAAALGAVALLLSSVAGAGGVLVYSYSADPFSYDDDE